MSYNGPPPYASDGCYYPPPPQAVIICQEIGNCPSCHVSSIQSEKEIQFLFETLARKFVHEYNLFGCLLCDFSLSNWSYLSTVINGRKMFDLWIFSMRLSPNILLSISIEAK